MICSGAITDLGHNPTTGKFEKANRHVYHVTIGPHGGLSSEVTVPSDAFVVAEVRARLTK